MYQEIQTCRISGSSNLIKVVSLGEQYLTGVFPTSPTEPITKGPIDLVWCPDSGLLQLKQSYGLTEMYGDNYGYRSGLNASMVAHLHQKAYHLAKFVGLQAGDTVLDIGSNDATFLKAFPTSVHKIGIDPTGNKFKAYYEPAISLVSDFFSNCFLRVSFPVNSLN
ncbi:MAG: hypothetical protein R2822_06610 [Spirosomataceae bacterium]